jgi:RNA polymerase sigma-70 factor (ECF subfamily)
MNQTGIQTGGGKAAELSDAEIFARAAGGDVDAFAIFYDRHSALLYALAFRILGTVPDAEDTLQEAMVQLWERARTYDATQGNVVSWAVTVTRNKAIDRIRSSQRKQRLIAEIIELSASDHAPDDSLDQGRAIRNETDAMMRAALAGLPLEQRQAIELAFFAGLTQSEIADRFGQPLGTVKARIRRGMLALRSVLEDRL